MSWKQSLEGNIKIHRKLQEKLQRQDLLLENCERTITLVKINGA